MLHKFYLIVVGLIVLALPSLVYAKEQMDVYIPSGTSIAGNYYGAGNTVEIAGSIESDLIVAGGNVIVTGAVGGDVIAAGGNVRITGPVGGNVRAVGGNIEIYGTVARNVTVGTGTLVIGESAEIYGHVTTGAGALEVRGKIDGGLLAGSGAVIISGTVGGPINLYLDKEGTLDIRETAVTGGEFNYYGRQSARIAEGSQLAQTPQMHEFTKQTPKPVWWWHYLISLFSLLVLGMVLVSLIPKKIQEVMDEVMTNAWRSLGWGVLWAVVAPIVGIILLVTVIGWPLAFALAAFYIFGLILAPAIAGATVGWYIKSKAKDTWLGKQTLMVTVLVGIFVYRLIVFIPVLGGLVALVGTLLAWGALLRVQYQTLKSFR